MHEYQWLIIDDKKYYKEKQYEGDLQIEEIYKCTFRLKTRNILMTLINMEDPLLTIKSFKISEVMILENPNDIKISKYVVLWTLLNF